MGAQGTGKGFPGDLVLDAGALIAFERGDPRVREVLRRLLPLGARFFVPSSVLAQVWRGGPRSAALARLVEASEVDSLSETRGKEVGVRLGYRDRRDIADAHVVCCALDTAATVMTSDRDDLAALAGPGEALVTIGV